MSKIAFYKISEEYYNYLKKYENKIRFSVGDKGKRPYIGILFKIDDVDFFAPLASPKEKYKTMKNSCDFMKIKDGTLGAINFNNMIPIPTSEAKLISTKISEDMNDEEKTYILLLRNQLTWCNIEANYERIIKKGKKLYDDYSSKKLPQNVIDRCCNFELLEIKCSEWIKNNSK